MVGAPETLPEEPDDMFGVTPRMARAGALALMDHAGGALISPNLDLERAEDLAREVWEAMVRYLPPTDDPIEH